MAEKHSEAGQDSFRGLAGVDKPNEDESVRQKTKRCSSTSPSTVPPHKSPRTDFPSPPRRTAEEETDKQETEDNVEPSSPPGSPTSRRKSWRRATLTRRSLPAFQNPYQVLCRSISLSLPQHQRLQKLMEAAMRLAIERTQNSLQSVPNISLESFQKQVEHIQNEWGCLAKSLSAEPCGHQPSASTASSSDPAVQRAMAKVQKAISRLQAEIESWEILLNKHRSKAEELERKVELGQERGISLDATSVAQSSQHHFIQSKPDYQSLLRRQQPRLHTITMIMDTQYKMVRELLSIKEKSQLLVKETSGRLAAEAGFQDLSPDPIRNLMAVPLSSATT